MPEVNAPMVSTAIPRALINSSDFELVTQIKRKFDDWVQVDRPNRLRQYRNRRAVSGVSQGQWTADLIAEFRNQGRNPDQFNILQRKLDIALGTEMTQVWDLNWAPIEGMATSGTESIKETYYSDKELCNFDFHQNQTLKDGLTYAGEIEIGTTTRFNPAGNICLIRLEPAYVFRDPYWISDDDDDCEDLIKVGYYTAEQIKRIWGAKDQRIEIAIADYKRNGGIYEEKKFDNIQDVSRGTKGHTFQVLERHWLEHKKVKRLFGFSSTDERRMIVAFPMTEDKPTLQEFAEVNEINWEDTFIHDFEYRENRISTVCWDLLNNGKLFDGRDKWQINRLRQFHFSLYREMGIDKGLPDDLLDLQLTINKRENKLTNIIEAGTGGGKLVSRQLLKNPDDMRNYLENSTKPDFRGLYDSDDMPPGDRGIIDLQSASLPGQALDMARMYDLFDRISTVSTAQSAMSESANESGVLFERKLAVTRIGQIPTDKRIQKLNHDIGQAYFYMWQQVYDGIPREFSTRDGKHRVTLNEIVYTTDGKMGWKNRPIYTPRCRVACTESPKSETWQLRKRSYYAELAKITPPQYRNHFNFLLGQLYKSLDASDADKQTLDNLTKIQMMKDMMADAAEMANSMANKEQAGLIVLQSQQAVQQILASMQMPQAGMPGAPEQISMEGGMPAGGPPMAGGPPPAPPRPRAGGVPPEAMAMLGGGAERGQVAPPEPPANV